LKSEIEETKVLDSKITETSLLIEEAPTEALTEEYQTLMDEKAALTADQIKEVDLTVLHL
jgi:hypothetical protein